MMSHDVISNWFELDEMAWTNTTQHKNNLNWMIWTSTKWYDMNKLKLKPHELWISQQIIRLAGSIAAVSFSVLSKFDRVCCPWGQSWKSLLREQDNVRPPSDPLGTFKSELSKSKSVQVQAAIYAAADSLWHRRAFVVWLPFGTFHWRVTSDI